MSLSIGELVGYLDLDTAGMDAGVARADGLLGKIGWGKMVLGAAGAAAGVGAALFGVGSVFDDLSDTIAVNTGKSGQALDDLTKSAENVGRDVPDSFGDIAPVLADISSRMGLTGDDLETLTKQFVEAGRITGTALDTKAITGSFNTFGLSGKDASKAMDELFQISQKTGVGMNDLATSVATHAANLKQFGFTYGQSANLVGQLDKAGIDSNRTLATLSRAMVTFAKDGKDPQQALQGTIDQIGKFVKAGDTAGAIDLAGKVFGTRGASQFVAAVKSGKLNVDALTQTTKAHGKGILETAKDTADFSESWQLFKNKALLELEPVGARVFGMLSKGMTWLSDNGGPMLAKVTEVIKGLFGGDSSSQIGENVGKIRDIITSVVAVVTTLWDKFGKDILAFTVTTVGALMQVIGGALDIILGVVKVFTSLFQGDWQGVWDGIKLILHGALDIILGVVKQSLALLQLMWGIAWAAIKALLASVWEGIKSLLKSNLDKAVDFFSGLPGRIGGALSSLGSILKSAFGNAMQAGKDKVVDLGQDIVSWIAGIPGKLANLGGKFAQAGRGLLQQFIDGMKNAAGIIEGIAGNVWNAVRGLLNGAIGKINAALDFTINLPGPDIHVNPPDIPALAGGGRATGATLAYIGEGREPETVLPDSMLRGLLTRAHNAGRAEAAAGASRGDGPLIGQVVQAKGEDAGVLAERLWYLTQTRG